LWLNQPRIGRLVVEARVVGESERGFYELSAWAIVPNHVHLLILPKIAVAKITRWLKGSTARSANPLLERPGRPFWQDESYDHWVRNSKEHGGLSAISKKTRHRRGWLIGLVDWPWSSGVWQAKPPAPPEPHPPFTESEM
jgi:hypothetical protein